MKISDTSNIKVGTTDVDKIYIGTTLVYTK